MDQASLTEYVNDRYDDPDGAHHYELAQTSGDTTIKLQVASDTAGAVTITNYEHEQTENDNKRRIKLLDRAYVAQFRNEFEELIRR